ncbi:MAG: hypothetical protein WCO19_01550 [Candidatus Saccharibacteria bacterium]
MTQETINSKNQEPTSLPTPVIIAKEGQHGGEGLRYDKPGQVVDVVGKYRNFAGIGGSGQLGVGSRMLFEGALTTDGMRYRYLVQEGLLINVDDSLQTGQLVYDQMDNLDSITVGLPDEGVRLMGRYGTDSALTDVSSVLVDFGGLQGVLPIAPEGTPIDSSFKVINEEFAAIGLNLQANIQAAAERLRTSPN